MSRITLVASGAAVALALIFLAAPWFALRGLQAAARDGDVHALAELIDYGAVRAGLRAQLAPASSVPAPRIWQDPVGAISRAIQAPPARPPDVDERLTPQGLHALIGDPQPIPAVRHWGPSRARFAVGPGRETLLTFQRRGLLQWRLVQLRVPPGASGASASSSAPP